MTNKSVIEGSKADEAIHICEATQGKALIAMTGVDTSLLMNFKTQPKDTPPQQE